MTRLLIVLALLLTALPARATVYVNEDFETNTTFDGTPWAALYESDAGDCECSGGQTTCAAGSGCGAAFGNSTSIQTSFKHLGARAMRGDLNVAGGAGVIISPSNYTSPNWASKTALYLRTYFYFDADYRWYSRNKIVVWRITNAPDLYINCNGVSWPWSEDDGQATCDVGIYFGMSPSDACGNTSPWNNDEFYYVAKSTGANKGQSWLVSPGGWYYIEAFVDTANGRLDVWMKRPEDATATQVITNKDISACSGIDGSGGEYFGQLEADGYLNATTGGSGGTYYLDDITIADSYIGLTDTSLAPLAPKLLRVLK